MNTKMIMTIINDKIGTGTQDDFGTYYNMKDVNITINDTDIYIDGKVYINIDDNINIRVYTNDIQVCYINKSIKNIDYFYITQL